MLSQCSEKNLYIASYILSICVLIFTMFDRNVP